MTGDEGGGCKEVHKFVLEVVRDEAGGCRKIHTRVLEAAQVHAAVGVHEDGWNISTPTSLFVLQVLREAGGGVVKLVELVVHLRCNCEGEPRW